MGRSIPLGSVSYALTTLVYVVFFRFLFLLFGSTHTGDKSPLSAGTPRHEGDPSSSDAKGVGTYSGPSPLRKRLQEVADTALAEGITLPMHTTFEVVRANAGAGAGASGDKGDGKGEKGMDFIVSVISSEALEAKVREHGKTSPQEVVPTRKKSLE